MIRFNHKTRQATKVEMCKHSIAISSGLTSAPIGAATDVCTAHVWSHMQFDNFMMLQFLPRHCSSGLYTFSCLLQSGCKRRAGAELVCSFCYDALRYVLAIHRLSLYIYAPAASSQVSGRCAVVGLMLVVPLWTGDKTDSY
jgi:hypothetical protein